ncbi:HD family phosphohydrolase [Synergistales bacterium]|nr:HD family phosphohydrolase [Synergistales bacterium]
MELSLNSMLNAFSRGLDYVEHDLTGISSHHSKRVAYICARMGKQFGLNESENSDIVGCALLHDSALPEYIQEESAQGNEVLKSKKVNTPRHCVIGEEYVKNIPFRGDVGNFILYHHESADGQGAFGKRGDEIPLGAALIHLGDRVDAFFHLNNVSDGKYSEIADFMKNGAGKFFLPRHAEAFLDIFHSKESFTDMIDREIDNALNKMLPMHHENYSPEQLISFASFFAKIIDYKSRFTRDHSMGLAEKADVMADYYHFDTEKKAQYHLAAALHDIGKLAVDSNILEKPDRLTPAEFTAIQDHAWHSYSILSEIDGFQPLGSWAALHHEKLDGSGYPFGLLAPELGFEERLMACLDIYQALVEKRPYKEGMSHQKAMSILDKLVQGGRIDGDIVGDVNKAFVG